jgi:hypothetical protein
LRVRPTPPPRRPPRIWPRRAVPVGSRQVSTPQTPRPRGSPVGAFGVNAGVRHGTTRRGPHPATATVVGRAPPGDRSRPAKPDSPPAARPGFPPRDLEEIAGAVGEEAAGAAGRAAPGPHPEPVASSRTHACDGPRTPPCRHAVRGAGCGCASYPGAARRRAPYTRAGTRSRSATRRPAPPAIPQGAAAPRRPSGRPPRQAGGSRRRAAGTPAVPAADKHRHSMLRLPSAAAQAPTDESQRERHILRRRRPAVKGRVAAGRAWVDPPPLSLL